MKKVQLTAKSLLFILLLVFASCSDSSETLDENLNENLNEIEVVGDNAKEGKFGDEGNPSKPIIICNSFKGITSYEKAKVVFAATFAIQDLDPSSIVWTINGNEIKPAYTPHVLRLVNYVSEPGMLDICFKASSPTCGELEDCITFDFK